MNKLKVRFMMLVCKTIWIFASKNNESKLSDEAWYLYCELETELEEE